MGIFDGATLPAWLAERARPIDAAATGRVLGTAIAGTQRWLTGKDESLGAGMYDAAMSEQDPNWKLKAESMKNQVLGQVIQNEGNFAKLRSQNEELTNAHADIPLLSDFVTAPRERWDSTPIPPVKSQMGLSTVIKVQQAREAAKLREDQNRTRMENSKLEVQRQADFTSWKSLLNEDKDLKAAIANIKDTKSGVNIDGWDVDVNGRAHGPSDEALAIVQPWLKAHGRPAFGLSALEGKLLLESKKPTAMSPMGKLQSERSAAVARGDTKAVADYDDAIQKSKSRGGVIGLEDAIEKAETAAKEAEDSGDTETAEFQASRAKRLRRQQKGGDLENPQTMTLPNGEVAVWIPGSKGVHILKDRNQEAKGKIAFEEFKASVKALGELQKFSSTKPEVMQSAKDAVATARSKFESIWKPTEITPPEKKGAATGTKKKFEYDQQTGELKPVQ